MLKLLLDHGADINATDSGGRTALHIGIMNRSVSNALELLENENVDANVRFF